ncbi:DUF3732 domain-containing protein [Rhizobium laguerreae]|uniref:DUF3732 domain-containing protein n=1 Tax=Rhizobium laguerreae TaxID=1076926 RepID=UPI001C906A80|nr:DUF3732 domain-containing protein [Rhizobium laguerreae]
MVSDFATEVLGDLPTHTPATGSRVVFSFTPNIALVAPRRAVLAMAEVGSDQNYLAIHLALAFTLQKLFETIKAPVLLVIDQISRPYYPKVGDEKRLQDMEKDYDQVATQDCPVSFRRDRAARGVTSDPRRTSLHRRRSRIRRGCERPMDEDVGNKAHSIRLAYSELETPYRGAAERGRARRVSLRVKHSYRRVSGQATAARLNLQSCHESERHALIRQIIAAGHQARVTFG